MPLLSFTVFKDKILDGTKTQTIRKLRVYPIKKGDTLYLYWHCRQKDCVKLAEVVCSEVFTIMIDREYWLGRERLKIDLFERQALDSNVRVSPWKDITFSDKFFDIIKRDGFKDADEMLAFFSKHNTLPEVFQVVRW